MRLIEKIAAIIGLVFIVSMFTLGTGYATPGTENAAAVMPNQAPLSLCTFSWALSNDDGATSSYGGYNPIDPGDTGNDPKAAQSPGVACARSANDTAYTTTANTTDTIAFYLSNAYPGYNPTIFFGLSNKWMTPGIVSSITFTNPNPGLLTMTLSGVSNNQVIDAGTTVVGALDIAVGNIPQSGGLNYNLSVTIIVTQTGPLLSISPASLPDGQLGTSYNQTLAASNGNPPYTWSVSSGSLPKGLSLNAAAGAITGTPTAAGGYNFAVQVTDSTSDTASLALSIGVAPLTVSTTPVTLHNEVIPHSITINILGTASQLVLNPDGSLAEPYTISLPDNSVSITISAGTMITADGEIPDRIDVEIAPASEQQGMPADWQQISKLYRLVAYVGDTMATHTVFSQPFLLTIHCDTAVIPAGNEVFTAYYETATGWVGLDSTYDARTGNVSTYVNHFTLFAGMTAPGTWLSSFSRWWSSNWWWIVAIAVVILMGLLSFILSGIKRKKLMAFIIKRSGEGATRQQLLGSEVAQFIRENRLPSYSGPDIESMVDRVIKKYSGK
jgi:hypothetical protein